MSGSSGASRAVISSVLAAISFLLVAYGLRARVPLPDDSDLRARFEYLAEHRDEIDLLFFGPSTVRCSLSPEIVDEELTRLGHPARSLNLGVPGAFFSEIDYLVEHALALGLENLRWVVIEFHYMDPALILGRGNDFTDRAVYWHDVTRSHGLARAFWRSPYRSRDDLFAGGKHFQHFLWRLSAFGKGPRIVGSFASEPAADSPLEAVATRRGFEPSECADIEIQIESRRRFLADLPGFDRSVRALDRQNRQRVISVEAFDPMRIRRQVERIRAAGAEPIYLITPILHPTPDFQELARRSILPSLMSFNSPRRYPEFYAVENRQDAGHLNARASETFSREFALRFARWIESGRGG